MVIPRTGSVLWPFAMMALLHASQNAAGQESPHWFTVKSNHYVVATDVSGELSQTISAYMEKMYVAYGEFLGKTPPENHRRFRIEIQGDLADYVERQKRVHKQTKFNNPRTIPNFMYHHYGPKSERNVVCGFLIHEYPLFKQLRHEGFHQYLRSIINQPPQWLNEGLAEMIEGYQWDQESNELRPYFNRGLLRRMREGILDVDPGALNKKYDYIPIRQIVEASKADWLKTENTSYAESWAICYFVLHGPHREYRTVLKAAVDSLKAEAGRAENTELVLEKALDGIDWDKFENQVLDYFRALEPPGHSALFSGQRLAAQQKYAEAEAEFSKLVEADEYEPRAFYFRGVTRYSQGKFDEAEQDLRRSIELFPEYSSALFALGKVYVYKRDAKNADKYLNLAKRYGASAKHVDPWLKRLEKLR